jgi:hypothetical protein
MNRVLEIKSETPMRRGPKITAKNVKELVRIQAGVPGIREGIN